MGKRKKKEIFDDEKSEQKKIFRIPPAPPVEVFKDKKKYNRKEKHKGKIDER